jgi:hypothetical protein
MKVPNEEQTFHALVPMQIQLQHALVATETSKSGLDFKSATSPCEWKKELNAIQRASTPRDVGPKKTQGATSAHCPQISTRPRRLCPKNPNLREAPPSSTFALGSQPCNKQLESSSDRNTTREQKPNSPTFSSSQSNHALQILATSESDPACLRRLSRGRDAPNRPGGL